MPERRGACSGHVTPREVEVLNLLAEGFGNTEIVATMGIGTGTVKHYINSATAKLLAVNSDKINSRVLLARYWSCPLFRIGAGTDESSLTSPSCSVSSTEAWRALHPSS
jgi:DNA-binding NarL/FixJ family response regulator